MTKPSSSTTGTSATAASAALSPQLFDSQLKISPVETSSFKTITWKDNPNAILYSGKVTACVIVVIRNMDEKNKRCDVVTMGHFFPNNAYDVDQALENLNTIIGDFVAKGGKPENSYIEIFGGYVDKREIKDHITNVLTKCGSQFADCKTSLSEKGEYCYVFSDAKASQALKFKPKGKPGNYEVTSLLKATSSLPFPLLLEATKSRTVEYSKYADDRDDKIVARAQEIKGMKLQEMDKVLQLFTLMQQRQADLTHSK